MKPKPHYIPMPKTWQNRKLEKISKIQIWSKKQRGYPFQNPEIEKTTSVGGKMKPNPITFPINVSSFSPKMRYSIQAKKGRGGMKPKPHYIPVHKTWKNRILEKSPKTLNWSKKQRGYPFQNPEIWVKKWWWWEIEPKPHHIPAWCLVLNFPPQSEI